MQPTTSTSLSILCIEDDVDTCEFLSVLFQEFRFEFAHTVRSALSRLEAEQHDLYILDNRLPDGSGIDLCRLIRVQHPKTPIIFTSGSIELFEMDIAMKAGADRYLLKPCEPETLKKTVTDLIYRY